MRRVWRWMLNGLTVLSLVLCLATVALWMRSYAGENLLLEFQQGRCLLIGIDAPAKPVRSVRESLTLELFVHNLRTPPPTDYNGVPLAPLQELHRFGLEWVRGTANFSGSDGVWFVPFWMVSVPLWLIALVAAIAPGAMLARRWIAAHRRRTNLCVKCRYDLTANVSGVCPECGRATVKAS